MVSLLIRNRLLIVGIWTLACFGTLQAAEPAVFTSPADLWQGFDPAALPLEVSSLEKWEEQGSEFEKLRFTAEEIDGGKVRVFAIVGRPQQGDALPGILHIHGGGQTASLDWVRYWTKRGYACVTYDFCGPWAERTEVTDWGSLKHGNMAHAGGGHQVTPTPRNASWYHWTLVARRALTLLASQPRVDQDRLGIFGISVGGTLCWSVAGSDARVKTAVPIYGCGYNVDGGRTRWGFPTLTPELALFQRVLSPEAHAPYVTCPILYLNATNDFHGWMDRAYDILAATSGSHWQAFTPWQNHHIAAAQGANLPAWMDYQLKGGPPFPSSPTLAIGLTSDGVPQATIDAGGQSVAQVDIYYSLTDKPAPNRFWRRVPARCDYAPCRASLPVVDAWQPLVAFANVRYASGICLSTNCETRVPGMLGKARATLNADDSLDPHAIAQSWFYARSHTDPSMERDYLRIENLPDRPAVVGLNPEIFGDSIAIDLTSHAIGDAQFSGRDGSALAFDCFGSIGPEGLQVTVAEKDWTPLARFYVATVPPDQIGAGWTTVVLPISRFQLKGGQATPARWQDLDKVNLQGTTTKANPLRIANLRWVRQP